MGHTGKDGFPGGCDKEPQLYSCLEPRVLYISTKKPASQVSAVKAAINQLPEGKGSGVNLAGLC